MAQICNKCSFVNPADATYCYNDGALLGGHAAVRGAQNVGAQPFPSQFVFPSGQVCGTFDQLALACQQRWSEGVDLLKQGFLASFLGGLGRADLAMAAQEAARAPDLDRGLDQLLGKLPSQVVQSPKLKVEPAEINVGVVPMGADRKLELHLSNQGMRLLYGSVVSDSKWLTLGEAPGNPQKLFQFGDEVVIPLHIRGQFLRAGAKPLEGQLLIDSNGGQAAIKVSVEVPVKPFSEGVLAGATTPRQVAEKAKIHAKDAAALFEKGAVAEWYTVNGWTYPVQGPAASGLGAVQQFFEALGLATAPKVEVADKVIKLEGTVGQSLTHNLEVKTQEKRPVYAYGTCDQPWLDVGRAKLNGRFATIPVVVPSVPNRPGETLQATVNVTANGNQRFQVPVTLTVSGTASPFAFAEAVPVMAVPAVAAVAAAPALARSPAPAYAAAASPVMATPGHSGDPFADFAAGAAPAAPLVAPALGRAEPAVLPARERTQQTPLWMHLLPAGVLFLALFIIILKDLIFTRKASDNIPIDPHARIRVNFDFGKAKGMGNTMSFGLSMLDPNNPSQTSSKKLTYDAWGRSNSTVVRIDGNDRIFGAGTGKWVEEPKSIGKLPDGKPAGKQATWLFGEEQIQVTQTVELIPGEPQVEKGVYKHLLDTCLVKYTIKNVDNRAHKVGLRMVLDTMIGDNDGVPFTVPGLPGLVDTFKEFLDRKSVPDFIQALEKGDLKDPGTVAQVNLKLGGKLEPPSQVLLTRWPGMEALLKWDVLAVPMKKVGEEAGDSAVALYWDPDDLTPNQVREIGFSYGLGSVSAGTGIGVTIGGSMVAGSDLTVIGLVASPGATEKLTLTLPPGFSFIDNTPATQDVPAQLPGVNRPSPVTWRVRAGAAGDFTLDVRSSTGANVERRITIKANSIF